MTSFVIIFQKLLLYLHKRTSIVSKMASVGLRTHCMLSLYHLQQQLNCLIKNTAAVPRYQPLPFVDQPQRHSIVRCCIGPTLVLTAAAAAAVPTAFRQPDLLCTLYDILMSHPSPICVANAVTTCVSFYEFTVQRHYK